MIEILRALLSLVTSHPEIVPALGRLVSNVAGAKDKQAVMRAAEAAAAKAAIRG
jgi:hypothetical protein